MKLLKRILPWIVVAVVGWFFYTALRDNWEALEGVSIWPNWQILVAIVLFTLAVVVSGWLWGGLLGELSGQKIASRDSVRIHCASWLLKYVPGQVGSLLNKLAWGHAKGISKKKITTSFLYENILMLLAGIALGVPVIVIFADEVGANLSLFVPLLVALVFVPVLSRKIFFTLTNRAFKLIGKKGFAREDMLTGSRLLRYQAGYLLPRLLNGVGFVFIAASMLEVTPDMWIGLGATYILAGMVGLLAIFVPGGIGVREAVIVAFVSVYFPLEQAIIVSLVARLWATVSDLGVAGIYLILNKGRLRQNG